MMELVTIKKNLNHHQKYKKKKNNENQFKMYK